MIEILLDEANNLLIRISLLLTGKCIYQESVVFDKKSRLVILCFSFLELLFRLLGQTAFRTFLRIAWPLAMLLLFLRGGKHMRIKRILALAESFFFLMGIVVFSALFVQISFNILQIQDKYAFPEMVLMLLGIITAYCYLFLYRKNIFLTIGITEHLLLLFSNGFMGICLISLLIQLREASALHEGFSFLVLLSVSVFYLASYVLLLKSRLADYYHTLQEQHRQWMALEIKHFEDYRKNQEETSRFRHDMMNHLTCMDILLQEHRENDAKEYISHLLGEIRKIQPKLSTGCVMLDCILSGKLELMQEHNITFSCDGGFTHGLTLKETDICIIFANAIDNAIEACKPVEEDAFIHMQIRHSKQFYYVSLKNSISKDAAFPAKARFTTKKNPSMHGFGLENIKNTVEKYHGLVNTTMTDGCFSLEIILPVPA